MDLLSIIDEAMATKESAWPLYRGGDLDRGQYLTASENLTCLRQLRFKKDHTSDRLDRWGYAERGHAVEAWVVDRLEEALPEGVDMTFYGLAQRSFKDDATRLSGTPDGVLTIIQGRKRDKRHLLEFKSVDPRRNLEAMDRPAPQHEAQVQQNMFLLRKHKIMVTSAFVIYIDASNFQRSKQFEVKYDAKAADRFATRAEILFAAGSPADLDAEGLTNNGCTYCEFTEQCSAIQAAAKLAGPTDAKTPPAMPDFAPRGITETLRAYAQLNEEKKAAEVTLKDLGEKIKAYAQSEDKDEIRTSKYIASVEPVAGRKTLDLKAYEEATGTPADGFYKVGKPSLRLSVRPVED